MINRLLSKLETPRRHLAFLVGLLALVFVLTAVVAWRASVAERDRADVATQALAQTVEGAVGDWSEMFASFAGGSMYAAFQPAFGALERNAFLPLDSLAVLVNPAAICRDCTNPVEVETHFSIHPSKGEVRSVDGALDPSFVSQVIEFDRQGKLVRFHPVFRAGILFTEIDGRVGTAFVIARDAPGDESGRLVGFVVAESTIEEMLRFAYRTARFLPSALTRNAPRDSLYMHAAYVGSATLLSEDSLGQVRAVFDFDTHEAFETSPIAGLKLAVAARPSAANRLALWGDGRTSGLHILLLTIVIFGLIIVAMLEVRREADLTRLRADFVSGVTHELRTPLAQIRMFTETLLLGRTRSDVERRRSLEVIEQEARRLSHLVENALLFSKTEGGRRARVAPEPTHFAEEIRHAVESLSLLCRNRSAEVRLELQENITVPVDRMALRQILINLVDNALKYGPTGQRITVGAALFDDVARVWVDDEGPGIPAEERGRVFESFYRLPRETQSRVSGSGIGLAVVRELAQLHGGSAWADSAPERGARIIVQFPDAYLRMQESGNLAAAS